MTDLIIVVMVLNGITVNAGYLTDSMARGYLSGALPFLYDDPSNDTVLKPLLMNSFGGTEMGSVFSPVYSNCDMQ